ncbi:uncharacterized protein [Macrobrachium rosenbergii]|uniref:uncharacterized protein n=1 Tax=Macrobrachium rosenbergii TaxID=79674 RepID=UPI0034D5D2F0
MYRQKDGIAMGSPLGILFANFYMGTVEEHVLERIQQPKKYARYINDVFIQADNEEEVEVLHQTFQQCSVLNYTVEFSTDDRVPFLDVMVTKTEWNLKTSVYTKSTNLGLCLNRDRECPAGFKNTTVRTFIRRALSHCSTWQDTNKEFEHAAQMLVNNGFTNKLINKEIQTGLEKWYSGESAQPAPKMTSRYIIRPGCIPSTVKTRTMKKIVMKNITPTEDSKKINIVIYYKNHRTRNLVMKNNPSLPAREPLKQKNMVYQFVCPVRGCPGVYIGMTAMPLSKRISCHAPGGCHHEPRPCYPQYFHLPRQYYTKYKYTRESRRPSMSVPAGGAPRCREKTCNECNTGGIAPNHEFEKE